MVEALGQYQYLIEAGMISALLALSQYVVLKAGVFSVAPVGLGAVAAYCTAVLQLSYGLNPWMGIVAGTTLAIVVSLLIAAPLARLRGIFQAVATLSLVIVVQSAILIFDEVTGGPSGLVGIPKTQSFASLTLTLVAVLAMCGAMNRSRLGTAFEALRQDEVAAASHGVSVPLYHTSAFAISGLLAGLAGGLTANYSYSLVPEQFGIQAVVNVLAFVVVGGVSRLPGPLLGTALLLALPEMVRPLQQHRLIVNGLLLIVVSIFLPKGIYDTVADRLRRRRVTRADHLPLPINAPQPQEKVG